MYALKMVGLVVLAATCLLVFFVGYNYFQEISSSQKAFEEATNLDEEIEGLIISGDVGENSKVIVDIPSGFSLYFDSENNQWVIDGTRLPEEGYDLTVVGPGKELGPGKHELLISVKENKIKVSEVD